jgi:hypothetical protein
MPSGLARWSPLPTRIRSSWTALLP